MQSTLRELEACDLIYIHVSMSKSQTINNIQMSALPITAKPRAKRWLIHPLNSNKQFAFIYFCFVYLLIDLF